MSLCGGVLSHSCGSSERPRAWLIGVAVVFAEREWRSLSRVLVSAMPVRMSFVWNRDRNPSAASVPQRVRACERSWRPIDDLQALPAGLGDERGEVVDRGRCSRPRPAATTSRAGAIGAGLFVDGVTDLLQQPDDQRCEHGLVVLGGGDVDRVGGGGEACRVEVRVWPRCAVAASLLYALSTPAVAEKMLERSRASVRSIPTRTSAAICASASARTLQGGCEVLAQRPAQHLLDRAAASGARRRAAVASSAAARSVQWFSFVVPAPAREAAVIARAVISASSQLVAAVTGDHDSRRAPSGTGSVPEGSNSQTSPISARASHRGAHHVRLGGRADDRPRCAHQRGDHHRARLPAAWRAEDHHGALGVGAHPFFVLALPRYAPPPQRRTPSRTRAAGSRGYVPPARPPPVRAAPAGHECVGFARGDPTPSVSST